MTKFYLPHASPDEKIILLLRRHWLVLAGRLVVWLLIACLPVAFYRLDPHALDNLLVNDALQAIFMLLMVTYYLYLWLFIFDGFVDYYLDTWIVTDRRLINIETEGLFSRQVSEQKLFRVQDVTSELKGIVPTFFNYGTVYIQTAAEEPRFTFKQIPNPDRVAQAIIQAVEQNKRYHNLTEQAEKANVDAKANV